MRVPCTRGVRKPLPSTLKIIYTPDFIFPSDMEKRHPLLILHLLNPKETEQPFASWLCVSCLLYLSIHILCPFFSWIVCPFLSDLRDLSDITDIINTPIYISPTFLPGRWPLNAAAGRWTTGRVGTAGRGACPGAVTSAPLPSSLLTPFRGFPLCDGSRERHYPESPSQEALVSSLATKSYLHEGVLKSLSLQRGL